MWEGHRRLLRSRVLDVDAVVIGHVDGEAVVVPANDEAVPSVP